MEKQKQRKWFPLLAVLILVLSLGLGGCDDGDDGRDGADGADGLPGSALFDASTVSDDVLADMEIESEITGVTIASPPVVEFTLTTAEGLPVLGVGALWEESNRFVRFTITKLDPGTAGDPDSWVAYTRDTTNDGSTPPDYDTGSSLVDNGDGSYVFTFNTDVAAVTGVAYEPTLTHRVAGQIGSGSFDRQNLVLDFVPDGSAVSRTRNIAVMDSCNECHDGLFFHGSRFKVEYCVNCHNPDLAQGEGNMSLMIHRIHRAGSFDVLDDAIDYSEVTYPQDLSNCRKCHNGDDAATAQGDNWRDQPNIAACSGCHSDLEITDVATDHAGGQQTDNSGCVGCHGPEDIEGYHASGDASANNPGLPVGQREIAYEIIDATINSSDQVVVNFRILSDGTALDLTALPADLTDGAGAAFRWPGFLLAWAEAQDGIDEPADFTNTGNSAGQPTSVSLEDLADGSEGTLACTGGICTATLTADGFPAGAKLRTVGLQGYFQQDIDGDESTDASLHAQSAVVAITGDTVRRAVVDSAKCGACHEWFNGHGGNRVFTADGGVQICTLCHVPNLSSSGRSIDPADAADRDGDPATTDPSSATIDLGTSDTLSWPEATNNFKDMVHGIHASDKRTTDYEFVRGRNDGIYYNWSEVTFPAENGVRNCHLCHFEGTYEVPLADGLLPTTNITTGDIDADDATFGDVAAARASVPNATDWVITPTAAACYACHDSDLAIAHMEQNGGMINDNRSDVLAEEPVESCAICHGEGKSADLQLVHEIE